MHVYIQTYMPTYINAYTQACNTQYIYIYVCVCVCVCVYTHTHMHICIIHAYTKESKIKTFFQAFYTQQKLILGQ